MWRLTREQTVAVAALCLFILLCAGVAAWSLFVRLDAVQELSERQQQLTRLEGVRAKSDPHASAAMRPAPATAFLQAATPGLAGASLQAHVAQLAGHHATLVSFAVQAAGGADAADAVRVEASMDITLGALQMLLYELESGVPYVLVDSMTVRPAAGQSGAENAPLRVTLGLRALWHRSPA